jgi:hypothetical protein
MVRSFSRIHISIWRSAWERLRMGHSIVTEWQQATPSDGRQMQYAMGRGRSAATFVIPCADGANQHRVMDAAVRKVADARLVRGYTERKKGQRATIIKRLSR